MLQRAQSKGEGDARILINRPPSADEKKAGAMDGPYGLQMRIIAANDLRATVAIRCDNGFAAIARFRKISKLPPTPRSFERGHFKKRVYEAVEAGCTSIKEVERATQFTYRQVGNALTQLSMDGVIDRSRSEGYKIRREFGS